MKIKYIIPAMFLACGLSATQAQNKEGDLSREMLLEKEYSPTIMEASRVNILPEIREPQVPKAKVEYSNYALPLSLSPQIKALKADILFDEVKESNKRGYVNFGLATNLNIDGDLGCRILDTNKDKLDIFYSHRSGNSKITYLQAEQKQKIKHNDNHGGVAYAHKFKPFKFFADIRYLYSAFNYHGYYDQQYFVNAGLPIVVDNNINQANSAVDAGVGFASHGTDDFNFLAKFSFYNFKQKYAVTKDIDGPRESFGQMEWDVNYRFAGENKYGLKGYMQGFTYNAHDPVGFNYYGGYKEYGRLAVNPYVSFSDVSWKAHIGVKSFISINRGKSLVFAPDMSFSVYPTENSELYLNVDGGITANSNYAAYLNNRYIDPSYRILDTRTNLDGLFGYKMNVAGNFWFDLFVGYRVDKDAYFFRPDYPTLPVASLSAIAGNVAVPDMTDAKLLKAGMQIKYKHLDMLEFGIKGQYNSWDIDDFADMGAVKSEAWNKPDFEADFTAAYKFDIPLRLDLLYHLESGRTTYLSWENQSLKMKNINELNLTASYAVNKSLSVYGKLNNILSQEYDLWYGYRAQGANIMIGATIKF